MSEAIEVLVIQPHATDGKGIEHQTIEMTQGSLIAILGGNVKQQTAPLTMFVQENNRKQGLDYNWVATQLARSSLMPNDFICGTVIVTGPPDADGAPTGIDAASLKAISDITPDDG